MLYTIAANFLVMLLILKLAYNGKENLQFWQDILLYKSLGIPLFAHILVLSVVVGLIIYGLISLTEYSYDEKISKDLQQLLRGDYAHTAFELEGRSLTSNVKIHQNIALLAEKLAYMSRQLQQTSQTSQEGSLKEEILKEERKRLSRELHDSVSQQLFAATMILSGINQRLDKLDEEQLKKQLDLVEEVINDAQAEMRALLLHLRPIELNGKRLNIGIENLLKELQTKVQINLIWQLEDLSLPEVIEDNLFRIMQEVISNTLRHSKATELEVYLNESEHQVSLRVIDDGIGFDVSEEKIAHYGLKNINDRVANLGGKLKIISLKGYGTRVEIKIPIVEKER
jgi:NarL family two-component system sensor histidine kinase LiaS